MRATLPALFVAVSLAAACGGNQPQQPPAASTPQATAPAKPAAPEPPRRIPAPAAADLHGAPAPSDEDLSELYDVGQDLEDLAQGDADAADNLATDLGRFTAPQAQAEVKNLAGDLSRALKGKTLTRDHSNRLAVLLYAAMSADAMTAEHRSALGKDLQTTLLAAGAAAADATAASNRLQKIASAAAAR